MNMFFMWLNVDPEIIYYLYLLDHAAEYTNMKIVFVVV